MTNSVDEFTTPLKTKPLRSFDGYSKRKELISKTSDNDIISYLKEESFKSYIFIIEGGIRVLSLVN
jgi:hypothetical protein